MKPAERLNPFDDTRMHEPKRQTPSEPLYSDDEDGKSGYTDDKTERDSDCRVSSAFDTCATASIVEGHTQVNLPAS